MLAAARQGSGRGRSVDNVRVRCDPRCMSDQGFPVSIAVRRPDGSVEQVRVGTAFKQGEGFLLKLELTISGSAEAASARPAAPAGGSGLVFPPYGRSKGQPIYGASLGDLDFYANGCKRTLNDPAKARW